MERWEKMMSSSYVPGEIKPTGDMLIQLSIQLSQRTDYFNSHKAYIYEMFLLYQVIRSNINMKQYGKVSK